MASEKDIQDVIRTLIAEGVGEGQEGMRRIAETILTRAEQRGISPAEVVRQRAQYTGYSAPGPAAVRAFNDPAALSAAQAAWELAQGPDDPTGGANHYWNPNIVNPSWAGGMRQLGRYGNHAFASDRLVPPRDVPNAVGTQLDVRRTAPTPVSQAPLMASSRSVTSPSGGNSQLQTALNRVAVREGNRVTPASAEDRVTARNRQFFAQPEPSRPSTNDAARRAALQMTQSYVGQDRAPARVAAPAPVPARPSTNDAARRAVLSMGGNQTYAGQSASPRFNGDPLTPSRGPVVATIPTRAQLPALAATAIGKPPSTRTVQTVPVSPRQSAAANVASARNEQMATRQTTPTRPVASNPIIAAAARANPLTEAKSEQAALRQMTQVPDRLMPTPANPPALYGGFTPAQVAGMGVAAPRAPVAIPQPAPLMASSAPVPASVAQRNVARNGIWNGNVFTPPDRPITSAELTRFAPRPIAAPIMAAARQPLQIVVQRDPVPQRSLYYTDPIAFGNRAVSQSGDTSTGSQADAAAARASGEAWRNSR